MTWYLEHVSGAGQEAPHFLDPAVALGDAPEASCPLRIPRTVRRELRVCVVPYFSVEGQKRLGQVVVHRQIARPVQRIFVELCYRYFIIERIVPIAAYGWDDQASMRKNNTSGFNYRHKDKPGPPELSAHALGLAIDLNPWWNPCERDGIVTPEGARYDPRVPGTLTKDSLAVRLFKEAGFVWGGDWKNPIDPQHFEMSFR